MVGVGNRHGDIAFAEEGLHGQHQVIEKIAVVVSHCGRHEQFRGACAGFVQLQRVLLVKHLVQLAVHNQRWTRHFVHQRQIVKAFFYQQRSQTAHH